MLSVGIIGGGVVGKATTQVWSSVAEVKIYDINPLVSSHTHDEVKECDLVFVCVPSNRDHENQCCDLTHVKDALSKLNYEKVVVLRSTVPVGTTRELSGTFGPVIHYPEFLTARAAFIDALTAPRHIVGAPFFEDIQQSDVVLDRSKKFSEWLKFRFGDKCLMAVSSDTSEFIKLALNTFFSAKLSIMNELYWVADQLPEVCWDEVVEGMLSSGKIANSHVTVPSHIDGKLGIGGYCLPKDLCCMSDLAKELGLEVPVIEGSKKYLRWDFKK